MKEAPHDTVCPSAPSLLGIVRFRQAATALLPRHCPVTAASTRLLITRTAAVAHAGDMLSRKAAAQSFCFLPSDLLPCPAGLDLLPESPAAFPFRFISYHIPGSPAKHRQRNNSEDFGIRKGVARSAEPMPFVRKSSSVLAAATCLGALPAKTPVQTLPCAKNSFRVLLL